MVYVCIGTKNEWINYLIVFFMRYLYNLCLILLHLLTLNTKYATLKSVFSEDERVCVTIVVLSTHILCLMVNLDHQNLLILLNKYASPVIALLSSFFHA